MTDNPHAKDAEGCGKWIRWVLTNKRGKNVDVDTVYYVAKWAGHWGRLALDRVARV